MKEAVLFVWRCVSELNKAQTRREVGVGGVASVRMHYPEYDVAIFSSQSSSRRMEREVMACLCVRVCNFAKPVCMRAS